MTLTATARTSTTSPRLFMAGRSVHGLRPGWSRRGDLPDPLNDGARDGPAEDEPRGVDPPSIERGRAGDRQARRRCVDDGRPTEQRSHHGHQGERGYVDAVEERADEARAAKAWDQRAAEGDEHERRQEDADRR